MNLGQWFASRELENPAMAEIDYRMPTVQANYLPKLIDARAEEIFECVKTMGESSCDKIAKTVGHAKSYIRPYLNQLHAEGLLTKRELRHTRKTGAKFYLWGPKL